MFSRPLSLTPSGVDVRRYRLLTNTRGALLPAIAAPACGAGEGGLREASDAASVHRGAARRCSSGVEQLTCNQQVVGSTPTIGSCREGRFAERFPSGQREQTVNLPANAYGGSNPPLSTHEVLAR